MSTSASQSTARATRIIVHGAGGRMGARICELAHHDEAFELVAAVERAGSPALGRPAAADSPAGRAPAITEGTKIPEKQADIVVDFSDDAGARSALLIARRRGAALLVGTTGLAAQTIDALRGESARRAVLVAPNTALGVAVLVRLAAQAASALRKNFSCAIVESHHSGKTDAPSGTALRLADAVRSAGAALRDDQILSVRGGDVVGEHTIRFAGAGEYIELVHRATSRDLFARGALHAAAWLNGRPAGWWTMEDALGFAAR